MNNKLKFWIYLIATYIVCELLVYFLSKDNFFTSPMYVLLPIIGFVGLYFVTPIACKYMKINKTIFFILFIALAVIAFYVALYFFFWNYFKVLNDLPIKFPFFKILLDSAYLEFIVAGILGAFASKSVPEK